MIRILRIFVIIVAEFIVLCSLYTNEELFLLRNTAGGAYRRKTSKIDYSVSLHLSPFLSRLVRFTGLHLSPLPKSKVMDTIP